MSTADPDPTVAQVEQLRQLVVRALAGLPGASITVLGPIDQETLECIVSRCDQEQED